MMRRALTIRSSQHFVEHKVDKCLFLQLSFKTFESILEWRSLAAAIVQKQDHIQSFQKWWSKGHGDEAAASHALLHVVGASISPRATRKPDLLIPFV